MSKHADKIEEIREAVLQCRITARKVCDDPTRENYAVDDVALNQVWSLLAELERSID